VEPLEPASKRDAETGCNLRSAFDQLKPREREMLWLAYVEQYDHWEIAALTGLRQRSVRMLLFRARHKLARLVRSGQSASTGKSRFL
jgi:RNA polymerase sigma-70 factor (ECF subfamily)